MNSAKSIDPDQRRHAAQANPDILFSPSVDVLFQESLLYTSIALRRNVSARISLHELRRFDLGRYIMGGFSGGTAHIAKAFTVTSL